MPLGILWLLLPPKSASGLSQASIFGASLGGLLLNLRFQHPQTTTTSTSSQSNNSRQFSRPLIDYDMALFLAVSVFYSVYFENKQDDSYAVALIHFISFCIP